MIRYVAPITLEYTPTESNHGVHKGYVDDSATSIINEVAETYATTVSLSAAVTDVLNSVASTYATRTELTTTEQNIRETLETDYATLENLNDVLDMVANTYATPDYVLTVKSDVLNSVAETYAFKTDLDGYSVIGHQHLKQPVETVPTSGIISLTENKTHYAKTISGNTVIGFDATGIETNDEAITFELLLKVGGTAYNILFGSNVTWLNGDEPLFTSTNTAYLLAFRSYDGGNSWIGSYQGRF